MARPTNRLLRRGGLTAPLPILTLALWQLRQTWRLLLVTGAGIIVAVVLVCAVPLYAQVAMSAGLRNTLGSSSTGPYVIVHGTAGTLSRQSIQNVGQQLDQVIHKYLEQYIDAPQQFSVQNSLVHLVRTTGLGGKILLTPSHDQVALIGSSMPQAASHVKIVQGHLPQALSQRIEVAVTPQTASILHATLGSTIYVQLGFYIYLPQATTGQRILINLPLYIVGLFTLPERNDPFWHGETFQAGPLSLPSGSGEPPTRYPVLVSNDNYLSVLDRTLSTNIPANAIAFPAILNTPLELFWYYPLDASRFDVNKLNDLANSLIIALDNLSSRSVDPPFVGRTSAIGPLDVITNYRNRIAVVRIPLMSLAYLIGALVLFFVSLMTGLLVDCQSEAIALLRSRGASRSQIFASLMMQCIAVGLIALIVGPLLAIASTRFLALGTLTLPDQGAINLVTNNVAQVAWGLRWSALVTVGAGVLAMIISIGQAIRVGALALRRESARSTYRPLWQRMRLDVMAAIIALVAYGFSLYVTDAGVLDTRVSVLVLPAVTVEGALFLLLGGVLLMSRLFPLVLHLASWLASRCRGATSMLALAQMARTPRQMLRITMLLALAIAFSIFTLSFTASQAQRIPDLAAYEVGSDFSGAFQLDSFASFDSWIQQEAVYRHIPGVTSATIGYVNFIPASQNTINVDLRAVDAATYAQTTIWMAHDSPQSVTSLMAQLIAHRAMANSGNAVPAIIDAAMQNLLRLSIGSHFTINNVNDPVNMVVIAEVDHIPTVNDTTEVGGTSDTASFGGVLVDYASYDSYSKKVNSVGITATNIWLRTRNDAASLASVRAALSKGMMQLESINDRRAIIENLNTDPLYLALIGVLIIAATTALLLAVVGNLVLSWLSARSRLGNFAIMRALGSTPRQVTGVLIWEQSIVYATAIVPGVAFGVLFSIIALPALVFTSVVTTSGSGPLSAGQFYIMQDVPPVQVVLPISLISIALGILLVICVIALGIMVRVVSRSSVGQALRLSED
ncbi:MAG TPA: FtsX-like permease family protein [Ktedonobacteraceae bacterium]|nr:FtsX-like permease family protein [Ktedonobacteraceae bacterium]